MKDEPEYETRDDTERFTDNITCVVTFWVFSLVLILIPMPYNFMLFLVLGTVYNSELVRTLEWITRSWGSFKGFLITHFEVLEVVAVFSARVTRLQYFKIKYRKRGWTPIQFKNAVYDYERGIKY